MPEALLPSTEKEQIHLNNSQLHAKSKKKPVINRHPYRAVLITLPVIVTALLLFILISYFKAPSATKTPEAPQLVKETLKNADRITAYQLYDPGENKKSLSLVSTTYCSGVSRSINYWLRIALP